MMLLVTSPTGKLGRAVLVTVAVREAIYAEPFVADQLVSPVYVIAGKHGATQETMSVITDEALGWKLGFGRLRRHGGDGRRVGQSSASWKVSSAGVGRTCIFGVLRK